MNMICNTLVCVLVIMLFALVVTQAYAITTHAFDDEYVAEFSSTDYEASQSSQR